MALEKTAPPAILAHCPDPACARVHRVKAKYAGQRGKCPACAAWMYVPCDPGPSAPPPVTPGFGRATTLFLLLGMIGLGAVAASPLLPGHTVEASGEIARTLGRLPAHAVGPDVRPYALLAPLALLVFPVGALFTGAVCRRPTALGRLLVYAAVGLSSALAFAAVHHFHEQQSQRAALEKAVAESKAAGVPGDATFHVGPYAVSGLAGAVGAAVMFLMAAFALHRRWWSRVAGSALLGLPLAIGAAWVYRKELGLNELPGFWEGR